MKKPCPVCKKTVDGEHDKFNAHVTECKAHMQKAKMDRGKIAKITPAEMNVKDKALADRIERAKRAAERERKLAPDIEAGITEGADPLRKIEMYARQEKLITDADYVVFEMEGSGDRMAGQGFIPLVDRDGDQMRHKDLEAYYRPKEIRAAHLKATERESMMRIHKELRSGAASQTTKIDNAD